MSQLNLDKLNLLYPLGSTTTVGRQAAGPAGAFDAHLESASNTSVGPPPEPRASQPSPEQPAAAGSRRDDRSEPPEPPATDRDPPQPAESRQHRDDQDESHDSTTAAADSTHDSKADEAKADKDGDKPDEKDDASSEADAAEVAAISEMADAAAKEAAGGAEPEAAEAAQATEDVEAEADSPAGQAKSKRSTLQSSQESGESAEADEASSARPNEVDDGGSDRKIAGRQKTSADEARPSGHQTQAAKPKSLDAAASKPEAADVAAEAAATEAKDTAHRITPREADAASIRPAAANVPGPADSGHASAETAPVSDSSGKVAAGKPAPAALRGTAPGSPNDSQTGQVDRVQFVQRVARAFEAASTRGGNIRLRLHPPELGSLQLELKVQDGAMTARLQAESTAARNLLLDNLPALRDRLAQHDIKIQQFEVDLGLGSSGGSPQGPFDQPQWHDEPGRANAPPSKNPDVRDDGAAAPPARRTVLDPSQFDVTI